MVVRSLCAYIPLSSRGYDRPCYTRGYDRPCYTRVCTGQCYTRVCTGQRYTRRYVRPVYTRGYVRPVYTRGSFRPWYTVGPSGHVTPVGSCWVYTRGIMLVIHPWDHAGYPSSLLCWVSPSLLCRVHPSSSQVHLMLRTSAPRSCIYRPLVYGSV